MAEGYGGPRGSYWRPDDEGPSGDTPWPDDAAYSADWQPHPAAGDGEQWSPHPSVAPDPPSAGDWQAHAPAREGQPWSPHPAASRAADAGDWQPHPAAGDGEQWSPHPAASRSTGADDWQPHPAAGGGERWTADARPDAAAGEWRSHPATGDGEQWTPHPAAPEPAAAGDWQSHAPASDGERWTPDSAGSYSAADEWPPHASAGDGEPWASPPSNPYAADADDWQSQPPGSDDEPWDSHPGAATSPTGAGVRSVPPSEPPSRPLPSGHHRSYAAALGWTIAGALLPGLGLLIAGRRRVGAAVLAGFVLLAGTLAFLAAYDRSDLLHLAVNETALIWLRASLWALGLAWVAVIVTTHRSLRPRRVSAPARGLGSVLVTLLAVVVLLPVGFGAHLAGVQGDLLDTVFKPQDKIRSETAPKNVTAEDPWAGRDRVNVLLLGGDGGADRQGVRPDSIQVASIDTRTGNTVLIALPRNLEQVPFPSGSKLADAYPDGIFDPGRRYYSSIEEQEWLLNAIYRNVPAQHPGLLQSDNPGADATKLAVSGALDIPIDYYLLINLDGFRQLIDALGGITVNINAPVAIGGDHQKGTLPSGYLQPGKDVHLNGYNALWFARGRWNSSDYDRMRRQRCTMNAIIQQADPAKVLSRYQAIAEASKQIVRTDIPSSLLPAFVDLAMKVKGAKLSSLVFDDKLIKPYDPDYDLIHEKTAATIAKSEQSAASGTSTVKPTAPATTPTNRPSDQDSPSQSPTSKATSQASDTESVDEMCAYHPGQNE